MIEINSNTSKKQLLENLTREAVSIDDLYILIDSLPIFLGTTISFTVFNYQISNYPRKVFWTSQNPEVIEFLSNCKANTKDPESANPVIIEPKSLPLETLQPSPVIEIQPIIPQVSTKSQSITASSEFSNFKFPEFKDFTGFKPNPSNFSVNSLLERDNYTPSSLLENAEPQILPQQPESQNFDSWLTKIEATKKALTNLSPQEETNYLPYLRPEPEIQPNFIQIKSAPKLVRILATSLVFSLIAVVFLVLFPTKAYTLEIRQVPIEEGATLEVPQNKFSSKQTSLSVETEIPASGQKEVQTERSTGKVALINRGSKEVTLNNGSFRLVNNGKEYQAITNSSLPKSFSIPAKNNINTGDTSLEFQIQATKTGSEYNLDENTRFDIENLLGQKVCSSCFAVATTQIKNTNLSGKKMVTDADQSLLRTNSEALLDQKKVKEIPKLQEENIFTNSSWFKNLDSKYTFNKNIGDETEKVSLKVDVSTQVYYLPQIEIEKLLQAKNQEINKFTDVTLIETTGIFDGSDKKLKLKMYYTYTKKTSLDKEEITQVLTEKNFDIAKSDIQKKYPSIKNIDKKETGVQVPGLPSKVDINLVEN